MATLTVAPKTCGSPPNLTEIRRRKGISLDEITARTKIAVHYLEAIERGDFQRLPGGIFSTSYIRQYAQAIEYDEWDLLACYDAVLHPIAERPPEPDKRGFLQAALAALLLRVFPPTRRAE